MKEKEDNMYTEYKVGEIPKGITNNFRLCYIESHCYEMDDRGFASNDGKEHLHLFFTNCNMNLQWGDDWDDKPYECNAGEPYSEHYEGNKRVPHEIIKVCFTLKRDSGDGSSYYYYLPEDFAYNSNFSVEMINAGIVAWLSISSDKEEIIPGSKYVVIHGGEEMSSVMEKLERFIVKEE